MKANEVDWVTVTLLINENDDLAPWEQEEVLVSVIKAAERWLEEDTKGWTIGAIEQERFSHPLKGIIDLSLINKKEGGINKVVDWKSTSKFTSTWSSRYLHSWQASLYQTLELCFSTPREFVYRGIAKDGYLKELIVPLTPETFEEAMEYVDTSWEGFELLKEGPSTWPRRKPHACTKYGRECEFIGECLKDEKQREGYHEMPSVNHLSFSSLETFWDCPEKFRLQKLFPSQDGDSEPFAFKYGKALHAAMAEVYGQARQQQKGDTK